MAYLGNTPTTQSFISGTDYFNGTGAQTAFTLTRTVASVNDIEAVVNNVVQQPNDAYTISGTTITFTSAPSSGTNNVYVRYLSTTTQAITPSQNTVNYNTFDSNMQSAIGTGNKNRIINGAMVIDQRNAGASAFVVDGATVYTLDRWAAADTTGGVFSVQQDSSAPTGFVNSSKIIVTTADATLTGVEFATLLQRIEGFNIADLGWGTANAKTVTLSFWVRSSLTGTFGGSLRNSDGTRSYPFTYVISVADTWEYKTVTIAGDTSGTWLTTNGIGISVGFSLGAGPDRSGTAGAWNSNNNTSATGSVNVMATLNATLFLTGVQLEVGTQATSFEYRQYQQELALCQRYYWKFTGANDAAIGAGLSGSATAASIYVKFPMSMRSAPVVSVSSMVITDAVNYNAPVTGLSATPSGVDALRINANCSGGGMTQYRPALMTVSGSGAGYVEFSSEL
jgi:hypothetical protein